MSSTLHNSWVPVRLALLLVIYLQTSDCWRIISRAEWGARPPRQTENITGEVGYVIVHHSFNPGVCYTTDACKASMRSMQDMHMDFNGWSDIGYSFAVGSDGNVYEGRGYGVVGAHAPHYNDRSIGLLIIGNFQETKPPDYTVQVAREFIQYSIDRGQLWPDYVLYGHRQVRQTDCPGNAFYPDVQKWPHWRSLG